MKRAALRLSLIVYMALIVFLSVMSSPEEVPEIRYLDKLVHFVMYFIMGGLVVMNLRRPAYRPWRGGTLWRPIAVAAVSAFLYGLLMEVFQYFIPHRSASFFDALANGAGGLFGAYIFVRFFRVERGGITGGGRNVIE